MNVPETTLHAFRKADASLYALACLYDTSDTLLKSAEARVLAIADAEAAVRELMALHRAMSDTGDAL
jgi:hypothetical protein